MDRKDIMQILPHRPPMLLLDEGELVDGVSICKYIVRGDEFFLQGHYPDNPVVPGVILCEMMAQASCLLLDSTGQRIRPVDTVPYLTGMDKVKFKKKVVPGDCITLKSELIKQKSVFYFVKSAGYVNDELCCQADISFALVSD